MKELLQQELERVEREICEHVETIGIEWKDEYFSEVPTTSEEESDTFLTTTSEGSIFVFDKEDEAYWNQLIGERRGIQAIINAYGEIGGFRNE